MTAIYKGQFILRGTINGADAQYWLRQNKDGKWEIVSWADGVVSNSKRSSKADIAEFDTLQEAYNKFIDIKNMSLPLSNSVRIGFSPNQLFIIGVKDGVFVIQEVTSDGSYKFYRKDHGTFASFLDVDKYLQEKEKATT
jgi:hypothetical protein